MDVSKLKSRKLWMTILGTASVTVLTWIGAPDFAIGAVSAMFLTYLGGQSAVDLFADKRKNGGG